MFIVEEGIFQCAALNFLETCSEFQQTHETECDRTENNSSFLLLAQIGKKAF